MFVTGRFHGAQKLATRFPANFNDNKNIAIGLTIAACESLNYC